MRRAAKVDANQAEIVISEKKRSAALLNLSKAAAKNAQRVSELPKWHCAKCGKEKPATVHQLRKTFCSMACMSKAYEESMKGSKNPNYKNANSRICINCGAPYQSYIKTRKYCTHTCAMRSGTMRGRLRKDANHADIVKALERVGCAVIDMSRLGGGVPDIATCYRGKWFVMEIKNPLTSYGKKGFTERQKEWAEAQKAPVYIVRSVDEALEAVGAVGVSVDNVNEWARNYCS